jgi:hypothetical protein
MTLEGFVRKARNFKNALILAGTMALASTGLMGQNAPSTNDTIWGNGIFYIKDAQTNSSILGANVQCTSLYIPGDTIPDNFIKNFTNPNSGQIPFNLPAFIDIYVGIPKNPNIPKNAKVIPNPSKDFTIAAYGKPLSSLMVYDMSGKKVFDKPINYDKSKDLSTIYMDLEDKTDGTYIFQLKTDKGIFKGKIIKNSSRKVGDLTSIINSQPWPEEKGLKKLQDENALYDVLVTAEGYENFTTEQTITEGDNGFILYYLEPEPGIPQHQDIGGVVYNESNNTIAGATVRIREQVTNELLGEMITTSSGEYLFENIPAGKNIYFQVGGISDKFSFDGDKHEIPELIQIEADTAKLNFLYILYNKVRTVPNSGGQTVQPTAAQIKEMYGNPQWELGAGRNILWDQVVGWNDNERQVNRTLMNNFMNLFGLEGRFVEVFNILNENGTEGYNVYTNFMQGEIGNHIERGPDQTDPYTNEMATNLGNVMEGIPASNITVSGGANEFYKEMGRSINIREVVSRNSFMNPIPASPNNLDRAIVNFIVDHYEKMISEDKAYFGLKKIANNIPSNK